MHRIRTLVLRDIRLALRSGGAWLLGLVFFAVFISLAAIALGGDFKTLRPLAPALIWLALVFSLLFSFEQVFSDDVKDGSLEHIKLSGTPLSTYVSAKMIAHWLLSVLPLLVALPLAGFMFDIDMPLIGALALSILLASPALIAYGAFSAGCLVGFRAGGFLLVLLTIPLLVPVLIFAVDGAIQFAGDGQFGAGFQALAGISLIATAIGIPATAAALNTGME